jgi:hypothetical protein
MREMEDPELVFPREAPGHFFPTHVVRSCSALCVKQRCSLITHTGADTFSPIPMPLIVSLFSWCISSAAINGPTFPMLLGTMLLGTLPASEQWWLPDDRTMMHPP